MTFYDGISRGRLFEELNIMIENLLPESKQQADVSKGLQIARNIVMELPAEGMWHDPGDKRYPVPEGVMLNLEITRGHLQTVERGWFNGTDWKKISGIIPARWVTGWMMLPQPRKEKQYD